MNIHIEGSVTHGPHVILLSNVRGIYADRGTPRKIGYWVKVLPDSIDKVKIVKIFCEGLSSKNRLIISAASNFNQMLDRLEM